DLFEEYQRKYPESDTAVVSTIRSMLNQHNINVEETKYYLELKNIIKDFETKYNYVISDHDLLEGGYGSTKEAQIKKLK
ncbi:hypothetical protein M9Y10_036879, partial [Tritrichomonas musculus]